jgi:hypothetical protein
VVVVAAAAVVAVARRVKLPKCLHQHYYLLRMAKTTTLKSHSAKPVRRFHRRRGALTNQRHVEEVKPIDQSRWVDHQ